MDNPQEVVNKIHTIFSFSLPYAIPVPNGLYEVYEDKKRIDIVIKRVQKDVGFSSSGFAQYLNDKYGRSSFSRVSMNFPWKIDLDADGRAPIAIGSIPISNRKKSKEIAIKTLNRFVEVIRFTIDAFWLEPIRYQDLLQYQAVHWNGKEFIGTTMMLDTGIGGLMFGNGDPFTIEPDKLDQINTLLREEKPLDSSNMLLLNAKNACLEENHRLATIEAVAGLEIVLSKFIKARGKALQLPNQALKSFLIRVGLTGNLTVVLRMLTGGLEQIDEDILHECTGAITVRNDIMHEGLLEVEPTETEKRIIAIGKMVAYLKKITPTPPA